MHVLQLGLLDAFIVCKLRVMISCWSPVSSHVIFSIFCSSMSGIPRSAGPSPGTTKNVHLAFLSLCLNLTVYTLNCLVSNVPYIFNMIELFFVVCKAANINFGNRILKTLNGIR